MSLIFVLDEVELKYKYLRLIYIRAGTMISQVEIDKRKLESSLLFMQQEHSTTLKALHEEISKLQKKCRGKHQSV